MSTCKIKQQYPGDAVRIKLALFAFWEDNPSPYPNLKAWVWDSFRATGITLGDGYGAPGDVNWYADCYDSHIDTFLLQCWEEYLDLDTHILDDDQPTTCPRCGTRTEFSELGHDNQPDGSQLHWCRACGYTFKGEFDQD